MSWRANGSLPRGTLYIRPTGTYTQLQDLQTKVIFCDVTPCSVVKRYRHSIVSAEEYSERPLREIFLGHKLQLKIG
jgi:hypothetical protein